MKVRWKRNYGADHAFGAFTEPGDVIEVDKDLGERLLTQPDSWEQVKTKSTKTADGGEEGDS